VWMSDVCVCVVVRVCVSVFVCVSVMQDAQTHRCTDAHAHALAHVHTCVYTCVRVYVCRVYVCMCVLCTCARVCAYVCMCTFFCVRARACVYTFIQIRDIHSLVLAPTKRHRIRELILLVPVRVQDAIHTCGGWCARIVPRAARPHPVSRPGAVLAAGA